MIRSKPSTDEYRDAWERVFEADGEPCVDDAKAKAQPLNPAEVVYGLLGWLTTRDEVTTLSAKHNANLAAELAKKFIDANKLGDVSPAWPRNLTRPAD